jgi:hypothetical protein
MWWYQEVGLWGDVWLMRTPLLCKVLVLLEKRPKGIFSLFYCIRTQQEGTICEAENKPLPDTKLLIP